jgi:hypothetical protein
MWMPRSYGLAREELEEMSDRCEVRWDFVPLDTAQATLTTADFTSAGIPEAAQSEVKQILENERDSLVAELRAIVAETFPGSTPDQVNEAGPFDLIEELERDVGLSESIRVHRYFADERAGRTVGPFPSSGLARAFRAFALSGDRLERSIGARFGPSVAAALRARHGGWPGRYQSRWDGCGE